MNRGAMMMGIGLSNSGRNWQRLPDKTNSDVLLVLFQSIRRGGLFGCETTP